MSPDAALNVASSCGVFWVVWLTLLALIYASCREMEVLDDDHGLTVTIGPLRRRSFAAPYTRVDSVRVVHDAGRRWSTTLGGILCTWGARTRPGVQLALREPLGPEGLRQVTIVVPDPERLAEFLNEKVAGAGGRTPP